MKRPRLAPTFADVMNQMSQNQEGMYRIIRAVPGPTVQGKYLHWDRLKYYTPPAGLTRDEWWYGLKLSRATRTNLPLLDLNGRPSGFNLVDPLPECLHHIDSNARGVITTPNTIVNADTRNYYLMRSLIDEAITSSQLEGALTTREVAKQMIRAGRAPRNRDEQMIFNNYNTMQAIMELKKERLTPELVLRIHRLVTDQTLDDGSGAGRFRRGTERIVVGDTTDEVFHDPPPAHELRGRIETMCRFANGEIPQHFIHPLVRSMILHFWLAFDHPFIDGNGRTARALFYWSMLRHEYWMFEYASISSIILKGPAQYGRAFLETETDENDLTYFLLYHADVVRRAIDELHEYLGRRGDEVKRAEEALGGLPGLNHRQRDLIAHALRHPSQRYTIEDHKNTYKIVYQTARTDLLNLADQGLFSKVKIGKVWHFLPSPRLENRSRA